VQSAHWHPLSVPFLQHFDPKAVEHKAFWEIVDRYRVAWVCIASFWLIVILKFLYAPYWLYVKILRKRHAARRSFSSHRAALQSPVLATSACLQVVFYGTSNVPAPAGAVNVASYYALAQEATMFRPGAAIITATMWALFITFTQAIKQDTLNFCCQGMLLRNSS
jgi:hypothetical protein